MAPPPLVTDAAAPASTPVRLTLPFVGKLHRSAVVVGPLTLLFIGVVVWMIGLRLSEMIFPAKVSGTVAERLLLAIEKDGKRLAAQRLADHLPVSLTMPDDIRQAIHAASRAVGVDAGYLVAVAARESGFDATARASQTSATGLYQFTEDTWLRVVKLYGTRHGLASYAPEIDVDDGGSVALRNAKIRARLLQLRNDPQFSALMAAELALDNKARLERLLGRTVTPAEIYIAHFLGVTQAAKMIDLARSAPSIAGANLLPVAAENNPGVFKTSEGPASIGAIVAKIEAYFSGAVLQAART